MSDGEQRKDLNSIFEQAQNDHEKLKEKREERIRERNLSFILIAAVILLLLAGIVYATSSWNSMNDLMRVFSLIFVSVFCYFISFVGQRMFKLNKTAFAFLVLGSLFIPISFIGIGYFQLFGEWLSLVGPGKYLFGMIVTLFCLPIYSVIAYRYNNRLFVWLSLVMLHSFVSYSFMNVSLTPFLFYLVMMLYNGGLVLLWRLYKDKQTFKVFWKEIPYLSQLNVLISSLFVFMFYFGNLLASLHFIFYFIGISIFVFSFLLNNKDNVVMKWVCFFVAIVLMLLTSCITILIGKFNHSTYFFFIYGFVFLATYRSNKSHIVQQFSIWVVPLSWLLSLILSYNLIFGYYPNHYVGFVGHMAISSLLLLLISYLFKYRISTRFFFPMFIIAFSFYYLSLVFSVVTFFEYPITRSILFFIGLLLSIVIVYESKIKECWVIVSILVLFFMLTLIEPFRLHSNNVVLAISLFTMPLILLSIYEWLGRKIEQLKFAFFWTAHGSLIVFAFVVFLFYIVDDFSPYVFLILLPSYFYSAFRRRREWEIKLFLYIGLTWLTLNLIFFFSYFDLGVFTPRHALSISVIMMTICQFIVNDAWKKRMTYYVLPLSLLSFFPLMSFQVLFAEMILATSMLVICMYLLPKKLEVLAFVPLPFYMTIWFVFTHHLSIIPLIIVYGITIGLFQLVGITKHKYIMEEMESSKGTRIDWYTILCFLLVFTFQLKIGSHEMLVVKLLPSLVLVFQLSVQINRVKTLVSKKLFLTFTIASAFIPYYIVIANVPIPSVIRLELAILPIIGFIGLLKSFVFKEQRETVTIFQSIAVAMVAVILMVDSLFGNTVLDALIIGALSLFSFIYGMLCRVKSYFFAGCATLVLTVIVQTRSLWGNLPWWLYLFTAGVFLLVVAALYEWQRQKKITFKMRKEKLMEKLKEWD